MLLATVTTVLAGIFLIAAAVAMSTSFSDIEATHWVKGKLNLANTTEVCGPCFKALHLAFAFTMTTSSHSPSFFVLVA